MEKKKRENDLVARGVSTLMKNESFYIHIASIWLEISYCQQSWWKRCRCVVEKPASHSRGMVIIRRKTVRVRSICRNSLAVPVFRWNCFPYLARFIRYVLTFLVCFNGSTIGFDLFVGWFPLFIESEEGKKCVVFFMSRTIVFWVESVFALI